MFSRPAAVLAVFGTLVFTSACSGGGGASPLPVTVAPTPGSQTATSSPAASSVTGRVVDDATGQGVPGATIVAGSGVYTPAAVYRQFQRFGVSRSAAIRVQTNGSATGAGDGSFSVANVPAGLQQFQVSAPGYATYNTGITVGNATKNLGNISLHHLTSAEATWLALVNADRATYGNQAVAFDQVAYQTAAAHANDMAQNNYFSHDDPQGRKPYVRYAQLGGIGFESENIAAGYADVATTEAAFMSEAASKGGHFLNIEDAAHDWAGLAIATAPAGSASPYGTYFDQEFVTVAGVWDPSQIPPSVPAGTTVHLNVLAPSAAGTVLGEAAWEAAPVAATPAATNGYSYPSSFTSVAPANSGRAGDYVFTLTAAKPGLNELLVFATGEPTAPFTISNGAIAMPIVVTN